MSSMSSHHPTTISWWSGQSSLLPFIPKPVKILFFLLILANYKSLPFVWHVRLWWIAYRERIRANVLGVKRYYADLGVGVGPAFEVGEVKEGDKSKPSSAVTIKKKSKPYVFGNKYTFPASDVSPETKHRFQHPMGVRTVRSYRADFDDCDYNLHLSNSSYAKNLDYGRMQGCIDCFSPLFAPGGWMALGGSHYGFVREVEMGKRYEIRMGIGGWDDKWISLTGEFVTYPKGKNYRPKPKTTESTSNGNANGNGNGHATTAGGGGKPRSKELQIREDGSVLHCWSVSTYVFKVGRITIPPKVVLAFCGYGDPSNWARTQRLLALPDKGKAWLQGGWKDEVEDVGAEWEKDGKDGVAETCRKGREYGLMMREGLEGLMSVNHSVEKTS